MTIWAGIAHAHVVPRFSERFYTVADYPSCFPEIAGQLQTIWCVTPFHISARFYNFLYEGGLLDRLTVSGSGTFFLDTMSANLPADIMRLLYAMPAQSEHPLPQLHFDLMLTGVRTALLSVLAGAAEIGLFGFDFYSEGTKRPWEGHDVDIDRAILDDLVQYAHSKSCLIRRY